MTVALALTFRAPTAPLSTNRANTLHWAKRRAALDPWKELAWASARNVRIRQAWPPNVALGVHPISGLCGPVPITVQVDLPFRDNRRRDAHNYTGTVVKAIVDGLVKAGIVPDDTPDWVTVLDSTLTVVGPLPAEATVTVTITERTTP